MQQPERPGEARQRYRGPLRRSLLLHMVSFVAILTDADGPTLLLDRLGGPLDDAYERPEPGKAGVGGRPTGAATAPTRVSRSSGRRADLTSTTG